jgi:hypothetical protein
MRVNPLEKAAEMRFRDRMFRNIVSPYGLATISYAFFLFACLIPPSVYSHYMHEADLMFLDPATILFYTLCVVAFMAGVGLVDWLFPTTHFEERKLATRISPTAFLLAPLLGGIALTLISMFLLIKQNPDIILLLLAQQGGDLKAVGGIDVDSTFPLAPLMLTGIIWLVFWRATDLGIQGWRRRLVNVVLVVAMLSVIGSATLIVNRPLLMLVVCGLAILYVARRVARKQVSFKFIFGSAAWIATCVVLLFSAFSFLRGTDTWNSQVYTLFGYTVASYNRLAALLNGTLRYPFGGRGVYLCSFVTFSHMLNQIIPLDKIMNWPAYLEVWNSEFGAIDRAGLDGGGIWSGAFGYIFSDLGWFSVPFVFGYGMLYGVVWNWMKQGKTLGIVLYPGIGFCALFWFGSNYLFDSEMVFLLVTAIILAVYESAILKSPATSAASHLK